MRSAAAILSAFIGKNQQIQASIAMSLTTTKLRREIGGRLAHERERLGFTQLQIAQLLGVPEALYAEQEAGDTDTSTFAMSRLHSCGFDVLFIITGERYKPVQEESELLRRFRELSLKGRTSVFMTLDALERLAPNIKSRIRATLAHE